jgi:hypothetical protein
LDQPRFGRGCSWQEAATNLVLDPECYWLLDAEQLPPIARTDCTRRLGEFIPLMLDDEPDP